MKRVVDFIRRDIWRIRLAETPPRRSFLIRNLRVVLLAVRGFNENKCALHASALTFYTLLSIVPVFALAFGVARGSAWSGCSKRRSWRRSRCRATP